MRLIRLYELACACYVYSGFTDFDKKYCNFLRETAPSLNMQDASHRKTLLEWLNNFGCRQFEKEFHEQASHNLELWHEENKHLLPPLGKTLLDLSDKELKNAEVIYEGLIKVGASDSKTVGPTGAAKIMFTLRKDAFPPWDGAIRKANQYDSNLEPYKSFLVDTKQQLLELERECKTNGISLSEIPKVLGRKSSSLVKLIDEYNWVTITRGCTSPSLDTVKEWHHWSKAT